MLDLTAAEIAARVRDGLLSPVDVVRFYLDRIDVHDRTLGAFETTRPQAALAEAEELAGRADLADLPLAGVPVAVKDLLAVTGEVTTFGSTATPREPAISDDLVVERLRAAGAVVVGLTRVPELAIWGATTNRMGATVNPWNTRYTPAGSSGGSGAAVAGGLAPLAIGSDGLGSIRLPSAVCGIFGIKPGRGQVPCPAGGEWFGLTQYGPMATTVGDAALMLDVLAATPGVHIDPHPPTSPIRVAVSVKAPVVGVPVSSPWREAALETGRLLRREGHDVRIADPPYPRSMAASLQAHWTQGVAVAAQAAGAPLEGLEPRNRTLASIGERWRRQRPVTTADADRWHDRLAGFLAAYDVLIVPALARRPLKAKAWHETSLAKTYAANIPPYPLCPPFNLADVPAASVPCGLDGAGIPIGVQVVARRGREDLVLAVARQLEQVRPWPRHAPGWS